MKVIKDTVLTSKLGIKDADSKTLARLSAGDVVEVLQDPQKEESVGVMRVNVKVVYGSDTSEGWITVKGNQETVYLEDCAATFKVVKETILTDAFDLSEKKEVTRSLHQSNKKL